MSSKADKKRLKNEIKYLKKQEKSLSGNKTVADSDAEKLNAIGKAVRFAESIKGIIYIILAVSLILSIILGEKGLVITLDDIIENLFLAKAGKVVLIIIAVALLIYGLKNLHLVKK